MSRKKTIDKIHIISILVVILGVFGIWYIFQKKNSIPFIVSNFEQCQEAGYPVEESYPPRCRTPQGQVYAQDIGNEFEKRALIRADTPRPNAEIESPLTIIGEARGYWYFEADFPVKLTDEKGAVLASGVATAQGEWMTEGFVPFTVTLTFESPPSGKGYVILEKNNPSGIPENADELKIPVKYKYQK